MRTVINIKDGVTRMPEWRTAEPVNFTLNEGEQLAITGGNGAGKTRLVNIITGAYPLLIQQPQYDFGPGTSKYVSDNIKYITFRDSYGADSDGKYFLQQRWNSTEIDHETPTTGELLDKAYILAGNDTPERRAWQQHVYQLFGIDSQLDKYVILLSSGELRKFQLTKALLTHPTLLILDNPFIGLDKETRSLLKDLLTSLAKEKTVQIILVLSKEDDIPDFITHVVEVKDVIVRPKVTREEYLAKRPPFPTRVLTPEAEEGILNFRQTDVAKLLEGNGRSASRLYNISGNDSQEVVECDHLTIRYGKRTILQDLNWKVMKGEHWALQGPNGSGKSTLLSLICADNPQGYACGISLFGHKRGSGETIWDIKKHIGYVSPEMHRAYTSDLPAVRIVASGLSDSVGLYFKPDAQQYEVCKWWMTVFGIGDKADTSFKKLSSGEQRLVLLARAFVKDPELLILDEPLHGLDNRNRRLVKDIIEAFCKREDKTLIMVTHYQEELPECVDKSITLVKHE